MDRDQPSLAAPPGRQACPKRRFAGEFIDQLTICVGPFRTSIPEQPEEYSIVNSRLTSTAIAALAIVSALALSSAPASASVSSSALSLGSQAQRTLTPEECSSKQDEIATLVSLRAIAQAELQWATPSQKADLIREIRELTAEIKVLSDEVRDGCPA
jgi:hypothetical protein